MYDAAPMKILGLETSCDETGVAVYDSKHGLKLHRGTMFAAYYLLLKK